MTKIINGKEMAQNLRNSLKKEIAELKNKFNAVPGLAVVQVGDVAASSVYVKAKTRNAKEVGIEVIDHHLNDSITESELLNLTISFRISLSFHHILSPTVVHFHYSPINTYITE